MGEKVREIKFRAWDNVKNKIIYLGEDNSYVFEIASYGIRSVKIGENPFGYEVLEHLKYLQFTGLKDKNGKEIYEGDVINLYCDCDPGDYAYCTHPPTVHKVVWNEEEAGYEIVQISNGKTFEDFSSYMEESWEVIGNIFANPELLEGK